MADYIIISDILAGTENAEQIISNSKKDDDTITCSGCEWFSYNGIVCSNIYASGNSWFGFGASSEHMKINRRDSAMWNLWREEGTYLGHYKFLRFRWGGYSVYNQTSSSYSLTYDIILFDTGDIMLFVNDIPKSNYNGIFTLGSVTYTAPTSENRYVTFYRQEDGSYTVDYAEIFLQPPFDRMYLIRNSGIYYTVVDGALQEITGSLNAAMFTEYGMEELPDGNILKSLSSPEVLYWQDSDVELPKLKATVTATPYPQFVVSEKIDLSDSSILGIESVTIDADGAPLYAISFDDSVFMSFIDSGWVETETGMTAEQISEITAEQWESAINEVSHMQLRVYLQDTTDAVRTIYFDFRN